MTIRPPITLARYVRRRNGRSLGARGSLRSMLARAFGASTPGGFWRHWNPIFGYALARYVHTPLRRAVSPPLATVITFAACGAFHDLVTTAVRQRPSVLFTVWFLLLGLGVVLSGAARVDLSALPRGARAIAHLAYLATCLAIALAVTRG